jgi:hypothetical protein
MPAPPSIVSVSAPPLSVSLPSPPFRKSLPASPLIVSFPWLPTRECGRQSRPDHQQARCFRPVTATPGCRQQSKRISLLNAEAFPDVSIALATIRSTPSVRQYARVEP